MAEHTRVNQSKHEDVDQKHRSRQQESQPSSDAFHAWDQGILTFTETPFYPKMEEHAGILSRIPFSAQRHEFIMQLNNTYGYRYAQRLVESVNAQAKLTVSDPNDVYEQEADRVAESVTKSINNPIQRQDEEEELQMQPEEEEPVRVKKALESQRQELPEEELQAQLAESQAATVPKSLERRINNTRGSGHPLSDNVREPMEQAFGSDFSGVCVHTDSEANELNQQLSAKAFTAGQDIFFRQGEYSPGSSRGQKLIAHELTHVVQQSTGRVGGGGSGEAVRLIGATPDIQCGQATFGDVTFSSVLRPTVESNKLEPIPKTDSLKIYTATYRPFGHVIAYGRDKDEVKKWKVGMLQTIVASTRRLFYGTGPGKGGCIIEAKPPREPIRDGDEANPPWYGKANEAQCPIRQFDRKRVSDKDTKMEDCPSIQCLWKKQFGGVDQYLKRTEGKESFRSWLAIQNSDTPDKVRCLDWVQWEVDWGTEVTVDKGNRDKSTVDPTTGGIEIKAKGEGEGDTEPKLGTPLTNKNLVVTPPKPW